MKTGITILILCISAVLASLSCRKGSPGVGSIRSVSPDTGHFGTVVTITGEGFDTINGYVTIDGIKAPVSKITPTTITLYVPAAHTGPVVVKSTNIGGSATGITTSGYDIYVCGYLYYGANPVAELWKNDTEHILTGTTQSAEAQAVQVSGQNVYVAGYLNDGTHDIATLWVNGKATALGGDSVNSYATAMRVVGNDVYVAGYRSQVNSSNHIALYWKNGSATTLSDGTADALTTGIALVGADLYVSGNMSGGVLWKDGVLQPLSYSTAGMYGYGNDLYLAGASYGTSGVWGSGAGNAGSYNLGSLSLNAVTADDEGVYTANASYTGSMWQPSYTVCTGAGPVTTVLLAQFGDQEAGNAWGICVRR